MQKIKNLLLDLGGVLLDIDFSKTKTAFEALGVKNFDAFFTQYHAAPLFEDLETGRVLPENFYANFRRETSLAVTDAAIANAWNAMLGDFPANRVDYLKSLRKKYRLFLLSNTNIIHYEAFCENFTRVYGYSFNTIFEKAFYSHEIGLRKPYPEIFQYVLQEGDMKPAETLFIDDTITNTDAARQLGLEVIHLPAPKNILDVML